MSSLRQLPSFPCPKATPKEGADNTSPGEQDLSKRSRLSVPLFFDFAPRTGTSLPFTPGTKRNRKDIILHIVWQGWSLLPPARAPKLNLLLGLWFLEKFSGVCSVHLVVLLLSLPSDFKACLFVTLATAEMKAGRKSVCSEWTGAGSHICCFYPEWGYCRERYKWFIVHWARQP